MKFTTSLSSAATLLALVSTSSAVTVLSQNFDTDPVNYTGSPFAVQASDPARYYAPTNFPSIAPNAGITGNSTVYLAAQNMNNDGDGTLAYETGAPAFMNFDVNATGYSDLRLSIDLAGMPTVETENFVRALVDMDGDTFYETTIFNFVGLSNSPYIDATLGALSGAFASFINIALPVPTAPDGFLHLRLEIFNDTNSQNEASGVDNILVSGVFVPEPGSFLLAGLAGLGMLRRRR